MVVYFDQRTGALHTVCWLKSSFSSFKHVFHDKQKKEENEKKYIDRVQLKNQLENIPSNIIRPTEQELNIYMM